MKILVAILILTMAIYFGKKYCLLPKRNTEKDTSYADRTQNLYSKQTETMGKFEVTVYRPDGSIYKQMNLPDRCDRFSVGSDLHDDLVIPDRRVSRSHLLIGSDEHGMFLRDNQSTNGTRKSIDGKPCKEDIDIEDNLEIYLGPVRIVFQDCLKRREEPVLRRHTNNVGASVTRVFGA